MPVSQMALCVLAGEEEKRRYTTNTHLGQDATRGQCGSARIGPEIAASREKAQGTYAPLTVREAIASLGSLTTFDLRYCFVQTGVSENR